MTAGERIAAAAVDLVGTRFRLHGRDPAHGLDCVGLAGLALSRGTGRAISLPTTYALRNTDIEHLFAFAAMAGLRDAAGDPITGDILLTRPGAAQSHLLIQAGARGHAHAHAGLRRVVLTPGVPTDPILRHWRIQIRQG